MEEVIGCVAEKVSKAQNEDLVWPFERAKLKAANCIRNTSDKSPGVDGLNSNFSQKLWNVVGEAMTDEVLYWLVEGRLAEGMNDMMIVLLPKKNCLESIGNLN